MTALTWKDTLRPFIPAFILEGKKKLYYWLIDRNKRTIGLDCFRLLPIPHMDFRTRSEFVKLSKQTHAAIRCSHTHDEMVEIVRAILTTPGPADAVIAEAGCFKGGSTAKLSLAVKSAGRKLIVFDSFEGLPEPATLEMNNFQQGEYCGQLEEVKGNVQRFGDLSVCEFVKGWFSETMPHMNRPVLIAFVDADLVSSVKDCLQHLYPVLIPGGSIFSHDGHLPLVVEQVLGNQEFWKEVGGPPPEVSGLGRRKLVRIRKPLVV